MRKVALLAMTLTLVVAVGVAYAVTPTTDLKVSVSPSKAGTKKKPRKIVLKVEPTLQPNPNDPAFAVSESIIHFDKNLVFNGKKFPACTAAQVQANPNACKKAQVGTGSATASVSGSPVNLLVRLYNKAPKGSGVLLRVDGQGGVSVQGVLVGALQKDSGLYGYKLDVTIPESLQQPVQGLYATLTDFKTTVNKTLKGTPYVGLKGCNGGKLHFMADFKYSDGTSSSTPDKTIACKK